MKTFLTVIPWLAVAILSLGYWAQVWRIHLHKEVRDLSLLSYAMLAFGFSIMAVKAYHEQSVIFMVKQVATLIPALFIVFQIWYHKDDRWHDDMDDSCRHCGSELEPHWSFCADCGTPTQDCMNHNRD